MFQECDVGEGQTFLMFWGYEGSDSRVTISMSASSASSLQQLPVSSTSYTHKLTLKFAIRLRSGAKFLLKWRVEGLLFAAVTEHEQPAREGASFNCPAD